MSDSSQTGIEVKLSFFPMALFLFSCTPRVEINGTVEKRDWGTHFFPTKPGKYSIKVYFGYLFMPQCGSNTIDVTVTEGNITRIKYYMWPWIFAKGSLKIVE